MLDFPGHDVGDETFAVAGENEVAAVRQPVRLGIYIGDLFIAIGLKGKIADPGVNIAETTGEFLAIG